jgi:hypothetical protein
MRKVEQLGEEVLHQGTRRGPRRQPLAKLFAETALAGMVTVIWFQVTSPVTGQEWMHLAALIAVLLTTVGWVMLFGRITITTRRVLVRDWRGQREIWRSNIGHGVHIERLEGPYVQHGYVALFDHAGAPVLRSGTTLWSEETVLALLAAAPTATTVGSLDAPGVEARWPGLLTWSYRQDQRSLGRFLLLEACVIIIVAVGGPYLLDQLL